MNCIEVMVGEHKNIKRMLQVTRKYCYKVLKGDNIDYNNFYKIIDFVRNYADKHHHGKEETMLFNRMIEELGGTAEHMIKYGMNIEHDLGRLYMHDLEAAVKRASEGDDEAKLDIIANAISYTHLLYRHIDKEDNALFKYAEKNLSKETLDKLNSECGKFEHGAEESKVQQRYLELLAELEQQV